MEEIERAMFAYFPVLSDPAWDCEEFLREGEQIALAHECTNGLPGDAVRWITIGYAYDSAETLVRRDEGTDAVVDDRVWSFLDADEDEGALLAVQDEGAVAQYLFWDESPSWYIVGEAPTVTEADELLFDLSLPDGDQLPVIEVEEP